MYKLDAYNFFQISVHERKCVHSIMGSCMKNTSVGIFTWDVVKPCADLACNILYYSVLPTSIYLYYSMVFYIRDMSYIIYNINYNNIYLNNIESYSLICYLMFYTYVYKIIYFTQK